MFGVVLGPRTVGEGGATDCDALGEASGKSEGGPKSVDDGGATDCDALEESLRTSEGEENLERGTPWGSFPKEGFDPVPGRGGHGRAWVLGPVPWTLPGVFAQRKDRSCLREV